MYEGPLFSASSLVSVTCRLFDDSSSDRCVVVSCGFGLHFCDDSWSLAFFHGLGDHLHIFFGKLTIQVICLFLSSFFACDVELFMYFGY